jgi:hypothetical protein
MPEHNYRGADMNRDHFLVAAKVKLTQWPPNQSKKPKSVTETSSKMPKIPRRFKIELRNRFATMEQLDQSDEWKGISETFNKTAGEILGPRAKSSRPCVSKESWRTIEEWTEINGKMNCTKSERLKERLLEDYKQKDKDTKKSLKKDKQNLANNLASEAEDAARSGNLKRVYETTRIPGTRSKDVSSVKDKNGNLLTEEQAVRERWKHHFEEVLIDRDDIVIERSAPGRAKGAQ